MGFSMKGPSMSISYGGESNKQQKSNLMKDNPVAKHASAMNMYDGKHNSPASKKPPLYQQEEESPLEGNAFGKAMADHDGNYDAAKKSLLKKKGETKSSGSMALNKNKIKKVARKALKSQKLKEEAQKIEGQHGYGSNKKSERKNRKADRKKAKVTKAYKSLSDEDKASAEKEYKERAFK